MLGTVIAYNRHVKRVEHGDSTVVSQHGFLTTEARSARMRRIRSKDTTPERKLGSVLWGKGLRYRKHRKDLPGKPDFVFSQKRVVVFVDGEFWHGHDWVRRRARIGSNRSYWLSKIERNMERDKLVGKALAHRGWLVLRFWARDIELNVNACADIVGQALKFPHDGAFARGLPSGSLVRVIERNALGVDNAGA